MLHWRALEATTRMPCCSPQHIGSSAAGVHLATPPNLQVPGLHPLSLLMLDASGEHFVACSVCGHVPCLEHAHVRLMSRPLAVSSWGALLHEGCKRGMACSFCTRRQRAAACRWRLWFAAAVVAAMHERCLPVAATNAAAPLVGLSWLDTACPAQCFPPAQTRGVGRTSCRLLCLAQILSPAACFACRTRSHSGWQTWSRRGAQLRQAAAAPSRPPEGDGCSWSR